MSIESQSNTNEVALVAFIQRFFSKHQVGKILKKCIGTKEKGVPTIKLLRYKLGNIFVGKSMYMQQKIESFKEDFSKNTFYRFLNSTKTNWLRFVCTDMSLSEEEIIRIYGKRWQISLFHARFISLWRHLLQASRRF